MLDSAPNRVPNPHRTQGDPVPKRAVVEIEPATDKTKILNRLRRLEGQVRGLHKMVEDERPCREILTLLAGVRSALDATGDQILETYLEQCQSDLARGQGDTRNVIEAVRLLRR
jgi:CsoR family transcriptional regulator, copper-sensing transcriptional repressor